MAQTGYTPISIYYSSTAGNTPTSGNLVAGELAINTADGKLFYKDSAGVVQTIASKGAGTIGGSTTQVQYNNAGALAGSANFVWDNANARLGIGISAPTTYLQIDGTNISYRGQLSINGGSGGNSQISLYSGATTNTDLTGQIYTASDNISLHLNAQKSTGYIVFETNNNTERVRISANGNLGVGAIPSAWGGVVGYGQIQTATNAIWTNNSDAGGFNANAYYNGTNWIYKANGYASDFFESNGNFIWRNAPSGTAGGTITYSTPMTLDTSGRLLIGTTTAPFTNPLLQVQSSADIPLGVKQTTSANYAAGFWNGGSSSTNLIQLFTGSGGLPCGGVTSDGSTTIYRANPTYGAGASLINAGINFAATQVASADANTLDDYEEGTYTPVIVQGVTSPSYTNQIGRYVKIGNLVYVTTRITINSGTTNGSTLQFSLPFVVENVANLFPTGTVYAYVDSNATNILVLGVYNTTNAEFYVQGNSALAAFAGTNFGSTGNISITMVYRTTT